MKNFLSIIFCFLVVQLCVAQKQDTITTKSGLKYVMVKPGNGQKPKAGQKVKVIYTGTLPNGNIFDSNVDAAPFKFTLDNKEVIPGWDEGVKLMSKGEKAVLIVPPTLGYGSKGVKDENGKFIVPQNSHMIFQIELVSFK
jgi:FKBP-type peptidyl-prolyl cis-trans isomerase